MRTTDCGWWWWCIALVLSACGEMTAELTESDVLAADDSALQIDVLSACHAEANVAPLNFGDPLRGLAQALKDRFADGLEEFDGDETPAQGLGPVFNDTGCGRCHTAGGVGGASNRTVTRFGRRGADGSFDPLAQLGGSLIQVQGITNGGCTQPPETVPAEANVVTKRLTTPLFGLGLLNEVPVSVLRSFEDPNDRNHDGVSGRVNIVDDPSTGMTAVGRFGWKAQVPSVFVFAGDAYVNEMGITNNLFPRENQPNGKAITCDDDIAAPALDDEDDNQNGISDGVEAFTDFMRLLAPPSLAGRPSEAVLRGAATFVTVKCAGCHRPALITGPVADVPQLSRKVFFPFSDLLLHDMGTLGDGIAQGQASGAEMRTAPLWGLRVRGPFLHDGRAATVSEAIVAHDGEGAGSRDAFKQLTPQRQADLLAFLGFI
jgi:CxxC motif-containing protein (DUF1111 family)